MSNRINELPGSGNSGTIPYAYQVDRAMKIDAESGPQHKGSNLLFHLVDACVFVCVIFQGVQSNLLWREGLYSPAAALLYHALCIAILVALHAGARRFTPQTEGAKPHRGLVFDLVLYLVATVPLTLFTYMVPAKGKPDFVWLPLEWHKLPENVVLLVKITPVLFICEIAVLVILIYLMCATRRRIFAKIAAGAFFITIFFQLFTLSKESNLVFYFFQYALIPLIAFVSALLNRPRMFARAGLASTLIALLFWQYIGVAPYNPRPHEMPDPAISVIYPEQGAEPEFPLVFFRDFYVDVSRNMLFTAYGPTSGLVRLDLDTGAVKIIPTHTGLVRYIWTTDDLPLIYSIDWIRADLLVVNKDKFTATRHDIYRRDASIPLDLAVAGDHLYVSCTERPGITEYDVATKRMTRQLDLKPHTRFNSGLWRMGYDPGADKLFSEIGYTDLRGHNTLLRIDRKTLRVDGKADVPAGGLEMLIMPKKRRIIVASFFFTSLWEYDMDTMKLVRRIEGPINCRNMLYDQSRGLIYATSFLSGHLHVIRYSDGKTIKKVRLGNKASSLFLSPDPGRKTLYLGNSWGVLKIDIEEFLK